MKVLYHTANGVIDAVGQPDSTQQSSDGETYWFYKRRTFDPVTGKIDPQVKVIFFCGAVATISY